MTSRKQATKPDDNLATYVHVNIQNASQFGAKSLFMNIFLKTKHKQICNFWVQFPFMVSKRMVSSYTATGYKMFVQYVACLFVVNNSVRLQKITEPSCDLFMWFMNTKTESWKVVFTRFFLFKGRRGVYITQQTILMLYKQKTQRKSVQKPATATDK